MKKIVLPILLASATVAFGQSSGHPTTGKCPVAHGGSSTTSSAGHEMHVGTDGTTNKDWWPNQLDLTVLR